MKLLKIVLASLAFASALAAQTITVAAAANLKYALTDIAKEFSKDTGIEVKIIGDETINAWQCYTATGAPFAEHPYGIAVEPMTAPANAFRTGDHLVTLAPNGDYTTVVRYEVVQK